MVGIVEAAAAKTMIRSQKGINRAFVVEMAEGGKSGLAVQVEGSCFETIWQLREGGEGILNLDKVRCSPLLFAQVKEGKKLHGESMCAIL